MPGTDLEKGQLRTYNAAGMTAEWRGDEATMREWDEWQRNRAGVATAKGATASGDEGKQARAPMIESDRQGMRVKLDEIEDNPQKYIGKTISVDAEIEEVFGPRIFTIDEPNWGDLAGEILVYVPTTLAALVKEDDRVTITGTVKPFVRADVEREWGWLGLDSDIEVDIAKKPVLVANRIVGGNNDLAMVIEVDAAAPKAVGTSGSIASSPLTELSAIAEGDEDLVARHVELTGLKVESMAKGGGFFVRTQNAAVFVLPAHADKADISQGDTVSLNGVVLEMPDDMEARLNAPTGSNDDIYVYATSVNKE